MSGRYRRYEPGDDDLAREGDAIFIGMQSKLSPDKIAAGYCRSLVNKTCRTGRAATRPGMHTLLQLNPRRPGGLVEERALYAAAPYTDRAGVEWLLVAGTLGVWKLRRDRAMTLLVGPSVPFLLNAPAPQYQWEFTQFGPFVILWRGEDLSPWVWDGIAAGFSEMARDLPDDGTLRIPGATYAEVIGNRLVITQGTNEIIFSEILRHNNFDPLTAVFRAQQGEDAVVRVLPFSGASALVFKSRSIFLLEGIAGDLTGASLTEVNRNLGLSARKACVAVGADVFFLSRSGVFRVSQVVQDRIATQPVPVSDPIEPFFRERIAWDAIAGAVMTAHEEYVYLAVPIDGASGNNAMLLYNTATEAWEGHWTFPGGATVTDLVKIDGAGRERLVAIDGLNGWVYVLGEGGMDRVNHEDFQIADEMETRGYLLGEPGHKAISRCDAALATWNPSFTVEARFDGANEMRTLVAGRTRSRTASYVHSRPDYDLTNANDDHGTPRREDYSMRPTPPFRLGANGVRVDQQQSTTEQFPIRENARWVSLRITNTQGRCDVEACGVQGLVQNRTLKTKA